MAILRKCDACGVELREWGTLGDVEFGPNALEGWPAGLGTIRVRAEAFLVERDNEIPDLCPAHRIELIRQFLGRLQLDQVRNRQAAGSPV